MYTTQTTVPPARGTKILKLRNESPNFATGPFPIAPFPITLTVNVNVTDLDGDLIRDKIITAKASRNQYAVIRISLVYVARLASASRTDMRSAVTGFSRRKPNDRDFGIS